MVVHTDEDPELKRINARRARDMERTKKLHNARLRNVGADIVGIQNQIHDKKEQKMREKQQEIDYANQQEDIRRYLTKVEQEEEKERQAGLQKLRQDWLDQSIKRPERREAVLSQPVIEQTTVEAETCGYSAAQKFDGEDPLINERLRLQAMQIREWNKEKMDEKLKRKEEERRQDELYANTLASVVKYQEQQEEQQLKEKARKDLEVLNQNKHLILQKQSRKNFEKEIQSNEEQKELIHAIKNPLLTEDPKQGQHSTNQGRVRPDHWKGMSKEEVKQIYDSNKDIIQEKEQMKQKDKESDNLYFQQQQYYQKCIEEQEYAEFVRQQQINSSIKATLDEQNHMAKEREQKQKELSQGKIEKGFFEAFGKSYR